MSYVTVPGVDEAFTFPVQFAASLVVALLAGRGRASSPVTSA